MKTGFTNRTIIHKQPTILLLLLICMFFGLLSPKFLTLQNLTNILIQASALAIVATGMTFVLLTAGIDLSVGSIMFLVGVISGKWVTGGLSIGLGIPLALIVGSLFGLFNGLFVVKYRVVPFIVTLASYFIGRGLGLIISDTRAINLPDAFLAIGSFRLLGIPLPIVIMVLIVCVFQIVLSKTQFGRQLYAIGHSAEKSRHAGIRVHSLLMRVYVICGFCAALGGFIALAQLGAVSPTFGNQYEFMAIAAAVLGGTSLFGGVGQVFPGTVVGAILIQTIQNGLVIVNADPYLYPLITGSIIFLIVLADSRRHFKRTRLKRTVNPRV